VTVACSDRYIYMYIAKHVYFTIIINNVVFKINAYNLLTIE